MQNHLSWWSKVWLIAERRQNSTQKNFSKMFLFTEKFILRFDQHQKLNSCIVEHKLEDISDFSLIHCRIWVCACCQVLEMAGTTMSKHESARIDHCTDREAHKLHKDCNLFVELECKELTCCDEASSWMVVWVFTEDVDRSKSKLRMRWNFCFVSFKGDCDGKILIYLNDRVVWRTDSNHNTQPCKDIRKCSHNLAHRFSAYVAFYKLAFCCTSRHNKSDTAPPMKLFVERDSNCRSLDHTTFFY